MPKLFVIMPFGLKRHEGIEYDFDSAYRNVIRPVAQKAGWTVLRIDEVSQPGAINDQFIHELVTAELVLADISIPNANVYYELGIRHSVSTAGTLLISSSGPNDVPFDLLGQRILFFSRSKEALLKKGLQSALSEFRSESVTSPLRPVFERAGILADPKLQQGEFEKDVAARIARAKNPEQLIALWKWLEPLSPLPILPLRDLAERLSDCGEWLSAADVLRVAAKQRPGDFEIHRRLGWFLQQVGPAHDRESLAAYDKALAINPNDPETLGLKGGREKRKRNFRAASEYYARGVALSPNTLYLAVNEAAMAILTDPTTPASGKKLYQALRERIEEREQVDEWAEIVRGESLFATGDFAGAEVAYRRAAGITASPKPLRSAAEQLEMFASVSYQPRGANRLAKILYQLADQVERPSSDGVSKSYGGGSKEEKSLKALPTLIHLSDLHFGTKVGGEKVHRFFAGENSKPLSQHLLAEFGGHKAYFKGEANRLFLVVSGDVAYQANAQEFADAKACLNTVCKELGVSKERVIVVPGNHDVNWSLSKADQAQRFDQFLRFVFEFYGPKLCKKKYPLIRWPLGFDKKRPKEHEIITLHHDESHNIMFVGLNTCVYESHQDHFGFVGEKQMELARGLIEASGATKSTVKVAVIHHHLHPFPEQLQERVPSETWNDLSTIRDAGFVERALESLGIDFVLHGHKHKPQYRETIVRDSQTDGNNTNRLIVCGAGSVSCTELEVEEQNQYQVIELKRSQRIRDTEFARLQWRCLSRKPGAQWVTAKAWDIRG